MAQDDGDGAAEMQTFLPKQPPVNGTTDSVKVIEVIESGKSEDFDPFKERVLQHPVSNSGTLTHLLKASLGTGILAMPAAFKASGLLFGVFLTAILSAICTYCAYILVQCAHVLMKKTGKTTMSFADVAEQACKTGPEWAHNYAPIARQIVNWGIFVTYFAACSCYCVIIAKNFNYVTEIYMEPIDTRITIALLLLPLILLAYIPNLKYLEPVSMVANICMGLGIGITFYYIIRDLPSISSRPAITHDVTTLPTCISIVIFAIEVIGMVMPLENNMKTPKDFVGTCGVLNKGMTFVTLIYIILGFFGYLKYGAGTADSVTLNLPKNDYAAQAVNILIGIAVFCTYSLVFYVCLDIAWSELKHRYSRKEKVANYVLRTVLVVVSVLIAIAVPKIVPFVALIGAFFFSTLGLLCPVFIEIVTYWDDGFGRYNWKLVKHAVIIVTGLLAIVFGSRSAIRDIISNT